jgi:hypothetical protein
MGIQGSMIVHVVRFTLKPNAPKDQVDLAFEQLRKQGREIKSVQLFCVGRDFGGEFDYGAMYIMKDIEGYLEYMMSPIHRKSDEIGLPLVEKFISMDITDDEDPVIGDIIFLSPVFRYADITSASQSYHIFLEWTMLRYGLKL